MKKIYIYIVCGILIIGAATAAMIILSNNQPQSNNTSKITTVQSEFKQVWGKDEMIVGVDAAFPPVTFKDASGNFVGVDIDFAKEVEKRTGVKMTIKAVEWDSIIPALLSKDIDIVWSGMTITSERSAKVDFIVYAKQPDWVGFTKENSVIQTKADLTGKIIAVQAGSSQEADLQAGKIIANNSWKEIKSYSTLPEAIIDLNLGRVDIVICDQDAGGYYIEKTLNQSSQFKLISLGASIGESGIAFRKEDATARLALEKVINEIIKDGTASQISMKWYGIDKYKDWE